MQYLILTPPAPVMGSLFMQTAHDEGNLFTLEISKAEEGGSVIYGKRGRLGSRYCMRCKLQEPEYHSRYLRLGKAVHT